MLTCGMVSNKVSMFILSTSLLILTLTAGCSFNGGPRGRWGWTPDVVPGDPEKQGTHSYGFSGSEGYGIFYTLRGGSIDLDHTRGGADLARWTYIRAKSTMIKGRKSFSVGPAFELTTNKIRFTYPPDWDTMATTEQERIADEVAQVIAPYVAYHSTVWHEMITWKGTHFMLIEPEFTSAFSWEDLYSNLMGIELAMQAIRDGHVDTGEYNRAMTQLIAEELERLGVVPKEKAIEIKESVRGSWFGDGKHMKRNMDVGFDDGWVTPSIIPGYTDQESISRKMPTLDGLRDLGIEIKYTISCVYLENGELKKIAGTKTAVEPVKDYPTIMDNIEAEAINKYGYMIR